VEVLINVALWEVILSHEAPTLMNGLLLMKVLEATSLGSLPLSSLSLYEDITFIPSAGCSNKVPSWKL
jgi:hypothetical protein